MDSVKNAWDQLPVESNLAYAAFRDYMMQGLRRSLAKTRERLGVNINSLNKWSSENEWQRRVAEFEGAQMDAFVGTKLAIIQNNQGQIITDELNGYDKMLAAWRDLFDKYMTDHVVEQIEKDGSVTLVTVPANIKDLKTLVETKKIIDDYARRAVGLPANYVDKTEAPVSTKGNLPAQTGGIPLQIPGKATSASDDETEDDDDSE